MIISPSIRDCVCFVYANIDGKVKPAGTAFFLFIPFRGEIGAIVVATALHVVSKIQQRSDDGLVLLRVNTRNGGYRFVPVDANFWIKPDQSDEILDVCFYPWPFPWEAADFDIRYFSVAQAATRDVMDAQALGVGNEVAFAGLFVKHHGENQNEPIVRFGNISAMPDEPVSTRYDGIDVEIEAYLVESRSVGGLSGSPVFVDPGLFRIDGDVRKWRATGEPGGYLLGVMHGHWDAPKEAAEIGASEGAEIGADDADGDTFGISSEYINMGIAIVMPIDKLLKLIDGSKWRQMFDLASKHLTGQETTSVVLKMDSTTGELIAKAELTGSARVDFDSGALIAEARLTVPAPTSNEPPEPDLPIGDHLTT